MPPLLQAMAFIVNRHMLVGLMQVSEGFSRQESRVSWENRLNTRKKVQPLLSKTALSPTSKYEPLFRAATTVPGSRCFWNSIPPKQDKGKHFGALLGNASKHSLFFFGPQKTRGSRSSGFLKMSNTSFPLPPEGGGSPSTGKTTPCIAF